MATKGFLLCSVFLVACVTSTNLDGAGDLAASRHLLAATVADDSIGTVYENNCSLLYSREVHIIFTMKDSEKKYLLPGANTSLSTTGSCTDGTPGYSVLNVNYHNLAGDISKVTMKITFNSTANGAWSMTEMEVSVTCAPKTEGNCTEIVNQKMDVKFIKSYIGFSYHCSQPPLVKSGNSTMAISFNKLQVQGFGVKNGKFSAADDCVGFFSGAVWSSLFVTLILTIILIYGISMISSINSMDRFDDPRGPGIQINVDE